MPLTRSGNVVDFDAEAAGDAALEVAGGALHTFVEFDAERFNPIYVDDETVDLYDDEAHLEEHFSRIHSYVHLDHAEIDLLVGELFTVADRVEYLVTAMDAFTLVRYYVGEQGVFLALDPDEPVQPVVAAVREAIDGR